jgi:hypothetical protein
VLDVPIHSFLYDYVGGWLRGRRQRWVEENFSRCRSVLDIGGMPGAWVNSRFAENVILLNVLPKPATCPFLYVQADARAVPFADCTFDLAFSNSAIERVGNLADQRRFASEMMRIGEHVYCQTPNRWFPVEPHHLALFLHWLPETWFTVGVHRWLTVNGWRGKPRETIRFLTCGELRELFPDCQIRVERFLWWPKSFAVWR